jgi:hypothetical protein
MQHVLARSGINLRCVLPRVRASATRSLLLSIGLDLFVLAGSLSDVV